MQGFGNSGVWESRIYSASFLQPIPAPGVEGGVSSQEEQPGSSPATVTAQNTPENIQLSLPWAAQPPHCRDCASPLELHMAVDAQPSSPVLSAGFSPRAVLEMGKASVISTQMGCKCSSRSSLEGSELQCKRKVAFFALRMCNLSIWKSEGITLPRGWQ